MMAGSANFIDKAEPFSIRAPRKHPPRHPCTEPNLPQDALRTSNSRDKNDFSLGAGVAADERDMFSVWRPSRIGVLSGVGREAQRVLLTEKCHVDVPVVVLFASPRKCALAAIWGERRLALVARISSHREDTPAFADRIRFSKPSPTRRDQHQTGNDP